MRLKIREISKALYSCSQDDILKFYEKYKDNAKDELIYDIELIKDKIIRK